MFEDEFPLRLAKLRSQKGVSAREMSLALGTNESYINNIEVGKALPSMRNFFYICDYLHITPCEFFDTQSQDPERLRDIVSDLKKLDKTQLEMISSLVKGLLK